MKLAGFLVGAGLAGLAVFAFGQLRAVTDDDLLTTYLADHCLPYATTGATPFADIGRAPGVYDQIDLRPDVEGGGVVLLSERRFVAQWGELLSGGGTLRLCEVQTIDANDTPGFVVKEDGFVERYADVIAQTERLVPERATLEDRIQTLAWSGEDRSLATGLRVLMVVRPGVVSSVLVGDTPTD